MEVDTDLLRNIGDFVTGKKYSFESYIELTTALVAAHSTTGLEKTPARIDATKLNLQRMNRVNKTMQLSPEWDTISAAGKHLHWAVISEPWCGDGSQIVPAINKVAEKLGIPIDILLRDENLALTDEFPFRHTRSIPLLICYDDVTGQILGHWGPRPIEAQQLVDDAKAAGIPHDDYMISLQNWYNQNKTVSLQNELFSFVTDCLR